MGTGTRVAGALAAAFGGILIGLNLGIDLTVSIFEEMLASEFSFGGASPVFNVASRLAVYALGVAVLGLGMVLVVVKEKTAK